MRRQSLLIILSVIILIILGFTLTKINFHHSAKPSNNYYFNTNATENFASIHGHDQDHPIWKSNHLGIIVKSKSPRLQADIKQACQNWEPAFHFDYYGYRPKKLEIRDHHLIYIKVAKLKNNPNKAGKVLANTDRLFVRNEYFQNHSLTISINDAAYCKSSNAFIVTIITHELGHAIGLKHSNNPKDLMYWYLTKPKKLRKDETNAVKQLYYQRH